MVPNIIWKQQKMAENKKSPGIMKGISFILFTFTTFLQCGNNLSENSKNYTLLSRKWDIILDIKSE